MTNTITSEGREKRKAEFERNHIERLATKYRETKDTKYLHILQSRYGLDLDFINGFDSGEGPRE